MFFLSFDFFSSYYTLYDKTFSFPGFPPPLPTLPNQCFGREPGHSLPPGAGEKNAGDSVFPLALDGTYIFPLTLLGRVLHLFSLTLLGRVLHLFSLSLDGRGLG